MTLEELYWIGQTVAAVAVVASLFYLAMQTRQMAHAQRNTMHLARAQEITTHMMRQSERDLASIFVKADHGERLDDVEFRQMMSFVFPIVDGIEEQHRQYKEGSVDEARWNATRLNMKLFFRSAENRALWRMLSFRAGKDFAALMNGMVEQARREPPLVLSDIWHAFRTEERSLQPPDFITAKRPTPV